MVRASTRKRRFRLKGAAAQRVDTSDRLAQISLFYRRDADRCARHRVYFPACIVAAAALEALLLSFCYIEDDAVRSTSVYKQKKFKSKRNKFLEFNLYQLIEIAAELKWVPSKNISVGRRKTTLPQLMHSVRKIRNMVHPGAWAKEGGPQRVYSATYKDVYGVLDLTRRWLLQRIELSLRQHMHREGILIED